MSDFSQETIRRLGKFPPALLPNVDYDATLLDSPKSYHQTGKAQAVPLPGSRKPGYSEVYRNAYYTEELITKYHPDVNTLYDGFRLIATKTPNAPCLGERKFDPATNKWSEYKYETYAQVAQRRAHFASGLVNVTRDLAGKLPEDKYIVALYGPNSSNWVVTDLACQVHGLANVALYDTLGPDTSEYILNLCESPVIVASLANIPSIFRLLPKLPHIKAVISLDPLDNPYHSEPAGESKRELLGAWANNLGIALYSFDEIEKIGAASPVPDSPPSADDIYSINFTSGTTGNPKGVIISQANLITGATMCRSSVYSPPSSENVMYSFLPLAHIYERVGLVFCICSGNAVGFPHGPLTELLDDIFTMKPTAANMVPRVHNRIAAALRQATIEGPGLAGAISRKAYAAKLAHLKETGSPNHFFWDRVWSNKVRRKLGFERTHLLTSGSAPLAKDVIEFLKCTLSLELLQGYGLTESLAGISVSQPGETSCGSCGPVSITGEVRLRDVPDLGYSADDKPYPRGEVMLRGPQIFRGYYKNDEKTLEAFDEDGWFHTGDVGMIDDLGRIFIIDRVKNFFKLSQGEYVAAEKIENIYAMRSTLLAQIFVHGDSTESHLVGIIGVDPAVFAPFVSKILKKQFSATDIAGLTATLTIPEVKLATLRAINGAIKPNELQGFEKIRNGALYIEPLTQENGLLTQTLKLKRAVAAKYFRSVIDELYKEGQLDVVPAAKTRARL